MAILVPDNTIIMNGVNVNYYPLTVHNPKGISLPGKFTSSIVGGNV